MHKWKCDAIGRSKDKHTLVNVISGYFAQKQIEQAHKITVRMEHLEKYGY